MTRNTLEGHKSIIALAQCGDLRISLAYVYLSDEICLRGMQREGEDGGFVIIFDRKFTDEVTGLKAFAQAVADEYEGALAA